MHEWAQQELDGPDIYTLKYKPIPFRLNREKAGP